MGPGPERVARANLTAFMRSVTRDWGVAVADYAALYDWSIRCPEPFGNPNLS